MPDLSENKLLFTALKLGKTDGPRDQIGVLDTAMFPARYYAGYIFKSADGKYTPAENATIFWHRTYTGAIVAARGIAACHKSLQEKV